MKSKDIPEMIEFMLRGVPLETAIWARQNWETLTETDKKELGFSQSNRSSFSSAFPPDSGESVH